MIEIINKIYQLAVEEHPEFKKNSELEMKEIIKNALKEIEEMEKVGDPKLALNALDDNTASSISALWVFSGPGTYDNVFMADRYKDYEWTRGMDHARVSYAEWLYRHIEESIGSGPSIIYNGSDQQNSILKEAMMRGEINVPFDKMVIVGKDIQNTVDQVKTFVLPEDLVDDEKYIGIVSHAPQLMRISYILNNYKSVLSGMKVMMLPLSTQSGGAMEYAISEIKGLLYYIYIGKNALKSPHPYIVHGKDR